WEHMDPVKRAQMRILFEHTRDLPRAQRREAAVLFRAMLPLSTAARQQLKQRWRGMTQEERKAWIRAHAPHRKLRVRLEDGPEDRDEGRNGARRACSPFRPPWHRAAGTARRSLHDERHPQIHPPLLDGAVA